MSRRSRSSTGAISASVSGPAKPANGAAADCGSKRGPGTQRQLAGLTSDGAPAVLGRLLVRVGVAESLASEKRRPTNVMLTGRPVSAGKPPGTATIG